tara:strand:- start:2374 stop:2643 length:270 start_codon:yes stop_codon:yes gene_type:complete
MKVTKEHFEFTAALISAANNGTPAPVLATLAATKFAEDNPRFDADRFKRACGVDADVVACVSDTGTVAWADVDQGDTLPPPPEEININD